MINFAPCTNLPTKFFMSFTIKLGNDIQNIQLRTSVCLADFKWFWHLRRVSSHFFQTKWNFLWLIFLSRFWYLFFKQQKIHLSPYLVWASSFWRKSNQLKLQKIWVSCSCFQQSGLYLVIVTPSTKKVLKDCTV